MSHNSNNLLPVADYNRNNSLESVNDHMPVTFDKLNQEKRMIRFYGTKTNWKPVYLSIVTNGYTRILRFDNVPPPRNQQKSTEEEEKKESLELPILKFRTFMKMVNLSICSPGKELVTIYL